ncbi:hypothetical protein BE20_05945 [Sorangium cellulosum]|uniref:Uncharacterized protein n=1 Tax=Sorangium cellulosum TaxID=56 RepID=A0A150RHF6_SORCE|nr:hypothetical protein BE18_46225 [Sorangium cellulosum]KYF94648.1 hypothetical protein BE20_05945 [Sorangium cellulosum]
MQVADAGDSELSDYDIELLKDVYKDHIEHGFGDMIKIAHGLPEWHNPYPCKVRSVDYAEILRVGGVSPETVESYESLSEAFERLDSIRIIRS